MDTKHRFVGEYPDIGHYVSVYEHWHDNETPTSIILDLPDCGEKDAPDQAAFIELTPCEIPALERIIDRLKAIDQSRQQTRE